MTVNELSPLPPFCLSPLHPCLLSLLESYKTNCLSLRLSLSGWLLNELPWQKRGRETGGGGFRGGISFSSSSSSGFSHHAPWGTSKEDKLWYPSARLPPARQREDFEGGILNKARMQRKCVRGLELGLKSHSEKKHSDNVIPAGLWINPLMHSDISELVLTGFVEPVYIRQIQSGGGDGVIIYQGASGVCLSSNPVCLNSCSAKYRSHYSHYLLEN